jgi:DMSO reductase family type II enzyme molybdopterin subunit
MHLERLDRRRFLAIAGFSAAASQLPLYHLEQKSMAAAATAKLKNWTDLYKERWAWDSVVKGSHGWLNCRSACNWNIYVKDGVVIREEQAANYEASEPGVPDFNPRGCQKGGCYTDVMYGPTRLTTPMKRAGARGEGKWQRISWDQALREIAEKLVAISEKYGPNSIIHDLGPHFDYGATNAARNRFFSMMGAALPDDWAEIGDLNIGATLTLGLPHIGGSADEWFMSDFLVVWMMNPAVTQIPDAHFLFEARYNGAQLTVVDPIYSATAIHADRWLPLQPGTDAALALATARHIWTTKRIDLEYVREQTDFPILVRLDTGRFLRESDFVDGGNDTLLYMWDPVARKPVPAPGCEGDGDSRIGLDGLKPPIEGRFDVALKDGKKVSVVPVGALVKEHLGPWTFERAASITGLSVKAIENFAEGFAKAKRPMILSSWGSNRYLHSDHMNRAKLLCLSLKGAIGREKGAGYHSTGWIGMGGFGSVVNDNAEGWWGGVKTWAQLLGNSYTFGLLVDQIAGWKSGAQVEHRMAKYFTRQSETYTNSASQNYNHQGIKEILAKEEDHLYPRPLAAYVEESQSKKWMPVCPPPKTPPRAWITGGSNVLRRSNMPQKMLEHLWPQLELVVDLNQKNTFTGLHADYLLPAAGFYEKPGIKYTVAYIPYVHHCGKAVKPVGEAKDEWEIFHLLSREVQRIAQSRKTPIVGGCGGAPIDLQTIGDRFSFYGTYGPHDAEAVTDLIVERSPSAQGSTIEELKKNGIAKFVSTGGSGIQENIFNSDWTGKGVLQALTDFVQHKWSWPTLTGRQQYYIDHPWFMEAGESLPTHIDSPKAGGDHPFQLVSCHSRWSIHSVWRDTPLLLRLQRGEPALYLNPQDAVAIGVKDGDWGAVSNDHGAIRMRIKYSTMVRPKVAYYFHAWEPHQFPDHRSYKFITPGLMNPMHFAGGEGGQLGYFFGHFDPGTHVQDTRVAIAPWTGERKG